jgi:hypothetical protein
VEVLCEEGLDGVRYVLWDATGWEMAVRIEKILVTVLHETHSRQVEEALETLSEGPEGFYKSR